MKRSRDVLALLVVGVCCAASCASHAAREPVVVPPAREEPPTPVVRPRAEPRSAFCPVLPPPEGRVVEVDSSRTAELPAIVAAATRGDTVLLADGTYDLAGAQLVVSSPGVTIRSASGDRDAVVLEGGYVTERVIVIHASDTTVADLTIHRARFHGVHVFPADEADVVNTHIYNVRSIDSGRQAIKINQNETHDRFVDEGVVACCRLELTDAGRVRIPGINEELPQVCYTGGVDAHQARGWTVRDNHIEGFWCPVDISQHGIHFWTGSRDTLVERNVLVNNTRGIGFGLGPNDVGRTYDDVSCDAPGHVDHYGGIIRNNFIYTGRRELFESEYGSDCGICLWSACGAQVVHNTVASTQQPFSSIEWRFETTTARIVNNLVSHTLLERDGGRAELRGNLAGASLTLFREPHSADLHLTDRATAAIDRGEPAFDLCRRDIDGDERDDPPDIGADELTY